ncbi:CvpA family protein [Blattabacterium cuenoti]|uniref:CvpA family protein n=1 Tax=Blattabacterium cuenoti TaxID=1653831 RepID=UPI00163C3D7E|nr:CvpA family protein [Blattabacterium cuenoti]
MTGSDIMIIIIVLYGGYQGFIKGLLSQLFLFMIFFILIYKGVDLFHFSSNVLIKKVNIRNNQEPFFTVSSLGISFFLITLIAFLTKKIIEFFLVITWINPIDKWMGGILGMIKYFFYLSICLLLLLEANKKIDLIPDNFLKNSFEKEFQYIFSIYKKGPLLFFFRKLEELYFLFSNFIKK